jgi:maltose alpha-D-glucosyltransferase/alpha-amylase
MTEKNVYLGIDPLWYKDAVIYQLHVRSFADSDGDGIGDFKGLTSRLDYLQDLGVTAIWLMPFYPSPLRDDGYDIADYNAVNPSYGTVADVRQFVREAHKRNLKVITELVCNHTSDQHPWFQRARISKPGSSFRDFYVWSDTPDKYKDARIIFKDFETSNWTWDPVANAYFWHRFYSHQPDLNFENLAVHRAIFQAMDFWWQMGVDGMRLDAIPYLYEAEGTNCENLPETHGFLKKLRAQVDKKWPGRMFLAEANQWPEDLIAYFGDGDECHMAFHFSVMPRLYMSVHQEDRFPIVEIMRQTPAIPDNCQWAIFLRNHDELTLEMVTEEERDYMYRVYAQDKQARINLGIRRRLAPLLGNNRRKIELMNGLLFSLPGTPVLYYGDEIGMGDNIYLGDRNGVRTPMQWSGDRNAGFSRGNPQRMFLPVITDPEYHYEMVNVENQSGNLHSLLWWTKRLIGLRKRYKAFGRGTLEFLQPENRKVLVFLRSYEDETLLVVANLSRYVQAVELDLSAFNGTTPVELFGQTEFPPVREGQPYFLTLGPHSFYWFNLVPRNAESGRGVAGPEPELASLALDAGRWDAIFYDGRKTKLEQILPPYLWARRWFGSKTRRLRSLSLREFNLLEFDHQLAYLCFVDLTYVEGTPETYMLPLMYAEGEFAETILRDSPHAAVARLQLGQREPGLLYDAIFNRDFASALLTAIQNRRELRGQQGVVHGEPTRVMRSISERDDTPLEPHISRAEQSNSSIVYGSKFILKLFRKLDAGINPDLELGRYLTEKAHFPHSPPVAGALEYVRGRDEPVTLAILQGYVPNGGDAWYYTLDVLQDFFEQMRASPDLNPPPVGRGVAALLEWQGEPSELAQEYVGGYLASAALLGKRTAEMHLALAANKADAAFTPEPFSTLYQRSLYQGMRSAAGEVLQTLRKNLGRLPEHLLPEASRLIEQEQALFERFQRVTRAKIDASRTRIHGDYHLGQVLYTGPDFQIIDYEGEPVRALTERRLKRSPLRDVAGMLRSFQYAAFTRFFSATESLIGRPDEVTRLEQWTDYWYYWVCAVFVRSYLETAGDASFIPQQRADLQTLIETYVLDKALYELNYELNNRPDWVGIPLRGILSLLD